MRTRRALYGISLALLLGLLVQACSGPWLRMHQVPEDGYDRTINYQFQARVHADSLGECRMIVVRVKAINKMYSKGEPPSRLQLFDDDCLAPVRFERVQYISRAGEPVRLSGVEVTHFFSDYFHLENELMGWLWSAGVI